LRAQIERETVASRASRHTNKRRREEGGEDAAVRAASASRFRVLLSTQVRETMVAKMKEEFADLKLTFSIGGQISFDVFPEGWDKTFCLQYLPHADFDEIHFFGDKTFVGGNDYEIFTSPRTVGHSIDDADPMTTLKKLSTLFDLPCPPSLTPPAAH